MFEGLKINPGDLASSKFKSYEFINTDKGNDFLRLPQRVLFYPGNLGQKYEEFYWKCFYYLKKMIVLNTLNKYKFYNLFCPEVYSVRYLTSNLISFTSYDFYVLSQGNVASNLWAINLQRKL